MDLAITIEENVRAGASRGYWHGRPYCKPRFPSERPRSPLSSAAKMQFYAARNGLTHVFGNCRQKPKCVGSRRTAKQSVPDKQLCEITGNARLCLTAERTALNFLQLLSAVATQTRRYADAVAGTGAIIVDTRKTLPGLRPGTKIRSQMRRRHKPSPGFIRWHTHQGESYCRCRRNRTCPARSEKNCPARGVHSD